jgi:hypothetical protein
VLTLLVDGVAVKTLDFDPDGQQYTTVFKAHPPLASGAHEYTISSSLGGSTAGSFTVN